MRSETRTACSKVERSFCFKGGQKRWRLTLQSDIVESSLVLGTCHKMEPVVTLTPKHQHLLVCFLLFAHPCLIIFSLRTALVWMSMGPLGLSVHLFWPEFYLDETATHPRPQRTLDKDDHFLSVWLPLAHVSFPPSITKGVSAVGAAG